MPVSAHYHSRDVRIAVAGVSQLSKHWMRDASSTGARGRTLSCSCLAQLRRKALRPEFCSAMEHIQ